MSRVFRGEASVTAVTRERVQAVAEEGQVPVDIYDVFAGLDGKVPVLCSIKPNGEGRIEQLDAASGSMRLRR